jgi:hypothetical protein
MRSRNVDFTGMSVGPGRVSLTLDPAMDSLPAGWRERSERTGACSPSTSTTLR